MTVSPTAAATAVESCRPTARISVFWANGMFVQGAGARGAAGQAHGLRGASLGDLRQNPSNGRQRARRDG